MTTIVFIDTNEFGVLRGFIIFYLDVPKIEGSYLQ